MKVVPTTKNSTELQKFASHFHQDFELLFSGANEGASEYFQNLSKDQKQILKIELNELIEEYPGEKQKGLNSAWLKLGAQWWDKRSDLRESIIRWIGDLD